MANWVAFSVAEVVSEIYDNIYVLPVIQRRLVWTEEKMELLFDTLLKGNSFGGIICIEEEKESEPLFAFRYFTKDGKQITSIQKNRLDQKQCFVIDGQQRLQSFYIGLLGSLEGKILYFDLFSDYNNLEFTFKFEGDENKLPKYDNDRDKDSIKEHRWYSVTSLYNRLKTTNDEDQVTDEVIKALEISKEEEKEHVSRNIRMFYKNIFTAKNIGISKLNINKAMDKKSNRQRIVELFRRLNDGGTKLSSYDLVASILKGYRAEMEMFLDDVLRDYEDIGFTQDTLISLLFILRDTPLKQMSEIDDEDAEFATTNMERIKVTIKTLKKFLVAAKLDNYYVKEKNRSFIPLYFIAYSIYYQKLSNQDLEHLFDKFDTRDKNFKNMYIWIYKSLLNGVFSRGCGWIPYKTGIKRISNVVKESKGKEFPVNEIFSVYYKHPLSFSDTIDDKNISYMDKEIIFYLLYDNKPSIRMQDIDHIHPVNILSRLGYEDKDINIVSNFQLIDSSTNRGEKNGKPLNEWISKYVDNKEYYLKRHFIPNNEELWKPEGYNQFIKERTKMLCDYINNILS